MKKFLLLCSMMVCTAALLPNMSYAKEIKSTSAAKKLAQAKVGSATVSEVDTDYENNKLLYEVSLYKGKRSYELTYRADNAKLIKYEWELSGSQAALADKNNLTSKQVTKLANKKIKNASVKKVHLEYDDGVPEYKVILTKGKKRYKLVYHAQTGKLLSYEWEITASSSGSSDDIGEEQAKKIALKKVPSADIIQCKYDTDDGVPVYEIEMQDGQTEYELTIHAETGEILEYDSERNDD